MNTILNNWFIHPEYKDEIGVYVQCKDYHHYLSIFDFLINPPTYYTKNKIFGYCNDEMDRFLTTMKHIIVMEIQVATLIQRKLMLKNAVMDYLTIETNS